MVGFIAVDGGGSKTELVLVNELGNILSHKIISCSNPNDIGMGKAINKLDKVIKELMIIAKDNNVAIECIMLAIAGIEFGDSKKILKNKLVDSLKFSDIYVEGDLASVKELGLSSDDNGIVIISGTGFNMAIKKENKFSHIGGWGYLADDYLSGFDLGKDALIYSSRANDKTGDSTILLELLENHFNSTLWYAMSTIYKGGIKEVASLSKFVVEAYKKGDIVAKNILELRVNKLAKVIKENTRDIIKPIRTCLFGGIFENNSFIVDLLKEILGDDYDLIVTKKKTIYGAVSLASKKMKEKVSKDFYANFDKEYKGL